jgi:tetratricopeptide (TPR) repeat protein
LTPAHVTAQELLGRVQAGLAAQRDVEAWMAIEASREPPVDWTESGTALESAIAEACRGARSLPDHERALAVLTAAGMIADLHPATGYHAVVSIYLAAYLATINRGEEALPFWEEAADGFQALDGLPWQELMSLKQWIDELRRNFRYYDALEVSERFITRAETLHVRAAELTARYLRGLLRSRVGREGALEDFETARAMSSSIEPSDRDTYEVPSDETLISMLGVAARAAGDYELSLKAFDELLELARRSADQSLEAEGWSELGYTHEAFGERDRAVAALGTAADIGLMVGDQRARRWRRQSSLLAGHVGENDLTGAGSLEGVGPVTDIADAYERSSIMEAFVAAGRFAEAVALAEPVLDWSRTEGVVDLEMSVTGLVAIALARTGDIKQAVKLSHKAIRIAEQRRNYTAALRLRESLALAFRLNDQPQAAADTLLSAIANGHLLLRKTYGSDARQRLAAGLLGATSTLAGIYSRSGFHLSMIGVTEKARTRNLEEWMRQALALASQGDPAAGKASIAHFLAAEVELEVRQLQGPLSGGELGVLTEQRDHARAAAVRALSSATEGLSIEEPVAVLAADLSTQIATALKPHQAILFLFEAAEGICAAVAYLDRDRLRVRGEFVPWDVDERRKDLEPWTTLTDPRASARVTDESMFASNDRIGTTFYEPIAALVKSAIPRDLIVVPQGDLALLPYWELARLAGADGMLCIAPSLDVYRLCAARRRDATGRTLIVGDVTGSLRHARSESLFVRHARGNGVSETTIAQDIIDTAADAHVVHVAAHGVFNPVNPYLGGLLVDEGARDRSRFVQYVASGRRFSSLRGKGWWRVLTVAECLTGLSLGDCRLAVLSACESGVPRVHGGGELTGLPNAFLLAGAQSVVASLWRVNDAATATLMYYFYDAFSEGPGAVPVAHALMVARERLAASSRSDIAKILDVDRSSLPGGARPFSHPYFTDAFQCYGSF